MSLAVTNIIAKDIRFPTSAEKHGSDAMHPDPDYSCVYVFIYTENEHLTGHGLTFTIGRGTEVVLKAVQSLEFLFIGKKLNDIFDDFARFWREVTSESQLRWIGPEKGVIHLATSALINALWDLWAKIENKPLWKLLVDMSPEKLVSTIDFRYISDVLSEEEAVQILKHNMPYRKAREEEIISKGYPAYTSSVGWIGYNDEKIRSLCREALLDGFTHFKAKVGDNIENDKRRLKLIREEIGYENKLMVDANQKWDINVAIEWMRQLSEFKPLWIEEPTSPDDVFGHLKISDALKPYGVGVALGEQCQNRVIFKQLLEMGAMQFCQLDATRLGGLNEVLAVALMAAKFHVPICPHAGGVGLCEYVRHISIWDYICVSGTTKNRIVEYVDHLHDIFSNPASIVRAHYIVPFESGYCGQMKPEVIETYEYPTGTYWRSVNK
ncbi:mitochondrial enolase superfamily member 1-like isoform X2 [Dinothrombium tinctorium]|uniref:Mitochondrial enolase superfamily member 1 n=1 Tax=Dinothrombium tinctorium TaxID=1965070 RepID=A0A3S4QP00_9ACAR|nr:mitochondrial enolase superfamily member 1-like isoform X2 [Dinothrombium tinctorium]